MRAISTRKPLRTLALVALACGLASAAQAFTLISFNGQVDKVSTGEVPPANGASATSTGRYSVSDDGCFTVFTSAATNLLSGQSDSNSSSDVFLYQSCGTDRVVALVSHGFGAPLKAAAGASDQPVISPDGNFVVFRSTATDIISGGANFFGQTNIFVWDRLSDTHTLVSRNFSSPITAASGPSQHGVISRAGGRRMVAFESLANDLIATDTNGVSDVFRYDHSTGIVNIVSVPNTGLPGPSNGGSVNPAIDGSGDCVVFQSLASNLVSDQPGVDDTNGVSDVFRWKFGVDPATILLSHRAGTVNAGRGAVAGDGASTEPSINDACSRFAFKSGAKDLSPGQNDNNGGDDVFHERDTGDAVLASHRDGVPSQAGDAVSYSPILSRDGNWLAYASRATDLAPAQIDSAGSSDVFVHNVAFGTNTLASHLASDPKTAASGESFAPEISTNGLYLAFESHAKDIDPNQNDGNGDSDVFLYNRRWNNAIVASRRFASIAIAGSRRSIRPALSGSGYSMAFTSESGDLIADDPETSGLDDVFLFTASGFMPFISARSTESQNVIEWITPPVNHVAMQAYVTPGTTCPTDFATASLGTLLALPSPLPANGSFLFTDPTPYLAGTDVCYSFFIQRDSGPILPGDGPARTILARTLETAAGPVKWASNVAGVASLAQVGIGAQNLIAVANEGGVYGLDRGPTGGRWSSGYWPFRTTLSPIQGRPGVLPLSVMGSTRTTFVGSQDGRVYAFDADKGARVGGALWYTSPALASTPTLDSIVQPGIAGMFTFFGGVGSHLLVGARPTTGPAEFYALDPATGSLRTGAPFTGSIGAINTTASVDYVRAQVYFASQEFSAGQPSLWCLDLTASGLGSTCWPPQTLPAGISGGPVERNGTVYVGDDLGQVWAFDASSGALKWPGSYALCGSGAAVKSYVLADRLGIAQDLYYATNAQLCAVSDLGASFATKWSLSSIPSPSAPVLVRIGAVAYLYVGSSNGRLYQIQADTAVVTSVLLRTGATIGAPAFDSRDNMIYVGSTAGAIYAVQAPLP